MFLDDLNSTLWCNICFILFYSCFFFFFWYCKLFLIVVQKEKLKLYSLWLMYFPIAEPGLSFVLVSPSPIPI